MTMAQNNFVPVSWNGESISTDKLNQMANNEQFLFDRTPLVRYAYQGKQNIVRDNSAKVMSGKTPFPPATNQDNVAILVYFGSFFSAGCHPIVTAVIETGGPLARKVMSIRSLGGVGQEIGINGFVADIFTVEAGTQNHFVETGGWVHWTATGY